MKELFVWKLLGELASTTKKEFFPRLRNLVDTNTLEQHSYRKSAPSPDGYSEGVNGKQVYDLKDR